MIISGTSTSVQNLKKIITIQSRIFLLPPRIRKCAQSDLASQYFLGLPSPHSQAPGPIFTINTSNDVAPHKGPEKRYFTFDPIFLSIRYTRESRQHGIRFDILSAPHDTAMFLVQCHQSVWS